ncbi:MAG: T9SS type A sorting domain-containing protein [Bacteroidetes bacterium]|nr:T9SS type A sorting domain-containing protein [Bacteroidota bacterium]
MKNYIFKAAYCTILVFLFNLTAFSQDNWTWLNPKPMGSGINASAYFPGTNTIVAVGPNGLILRSTDHGSSWSHIQSNLFANLGTISAVNSTTCFIAGDNATLLKTTDAGITWNIVPISGVSGAIASLHFVSTTTGFLRQGTSVYRSTDGGLNWSLLVDTFGSTFGTASAIHALSDTEVIIGTTLGKITRATSSSSWDPSLLFTIESNSTVNSVSFNGSKGIATSWGGVAWSSDGGATWANSSDDVFDFNGAIFLSSSDAVAFTGIEQIKFSSDAGQAWSNIATSGSLALTNAASNLSGNGIILGSSGIQYNTINSGENWTKSSTSISSGTLRSITCNGSNILATGDNGQVIRSTNGGTSFTSATVAGGITIQDIKFTNSTTAYLVAGASIYKSTDAGGTWNVSHAYASTTFYEISFFDDNNGIAVGTSGKTSYTTNAGTSWNNVVYTPTFTIYTITTSGSSTAFASGDNGKILKTTDKGASWTNSNTITGPINSVFSIDGVNVWAVGNFGNIFKSPDAGANWSPVTSGTTSHLQSVRFSDSQNGIIVGNLGFTLKTTNGGLTWTGTMQMTDKNLMSAALIDGSTTLLCGGNGTVLKSYNAPLPVELTSFTASVRNNTVNLNWETATEIDNYGFEIERKDNSTSWTKIGFVGGHYTSNSPKYYNFSDKPTGSGKHSYRLKQIDNDGKFEYSPEVVVLIDNLPNGYLLEQNYPNPFNPETSIKFVLKENTKASLKVYNPMGELVATLFEGIADAGRYYDIKFYGNNLASGFYIYTLDAGKHRQTRKMILMK